MLLRFVDLAWKDHLLALDHLKEGIGLRGYGQRDPLQEYKKESYELFGALKERVEDSVIKTLFRLEPVSEEQMDRERQKRDRIATQPSRMSFSAPQSAGASKPTAALPESPFGAAASAHSGGSAAGPRREDSGPQRPLLVRLGQEVQEVPRRHRRRRRLTFTRTPLKRPRAGIAPGPRGFRTSPAGYFLRV